jgi:hypothetical protein
MCLIVHNLLEPLLKELSLKDIIYVDPRSVDVIGVQLTCLNNLLHFYDGGTSSRNHILVEVSSRFIEYEISCGISLPCLDESVIGYDRFLHDVLSSLELPYFPWL